MMASNNQEVKDEIAEVASISIHSDDQQKSTMSGATEPPKAAENIITNNDTKQINSTTTLLDLNYDCLREIFSYLTLNETLTLFDIKNRLLISMAYDRMATFKDWNINMRQVLCRNPAYTEEQLEIIGNNLNSLTLSAGYGLRDDQVLRIFRPLCQSNQNSEILQKLCLNYVNFNEQYANCVKRVANYLKILDLSFCRLTDDLLQKILVNCDSLRELYLMGNYDLQGSTLNHISSKELEFVIVELADSYIFSPQKCMEKFPNMKMRTHTKEGDFHYPLLTLTPASRPFEFPLHLDTFISDNAFASYNDLNIWAHQ